MDLRPLLLGMTVLLLAMAVYFFVTGNAALGAAMFAIGMSQISVLLAITAAKAKAAKTDKGDAA
jgi:hypothetical protein